MIIELSIIFGDNSILGLFFGTVLYVLYLK